MINGSSLMLGTGLVAAYFYNF